MCVRGLRRILCRCPCRLLRRILCRCPCRLLTSVKHRVKQAWVAVNIAVRRAVGTVLVVMPAVTCQARVPSRVALALMV